MFREIRKEPDLWIATFKGPLKNETWIHAIRVNLQEKFNIWTVQVSFSPKLQICECEEQTKEKNDVTTHYKNNQSMHGPGETQERKGV